MMRAILVDAVHDLAPDPDSRVFPDGMTNVKRREEMRTAFEHVFAERHAA